jgi:hypothetical protein
VQFLKIVGACVIAAALYGIVHDQITVRICLEYFTVFHPPIFGGTQSPTLLAFGWGVIATWWAGAMIGIPLGIAARVGSRPKLSLSDLLPLIRTLLICMAASAVVAGVVGFVWGEVPPSFASLLPPSMHRRCVADWWAHNASYASGFLGGIIVCVVAYVRRGSLRAHSA